MRPVTNFAKNNAYSGTATATYEGRTEVNVDELLRKPNVIKILRQTGKIQVVPDPLAREAAGSK
jgi:hypothetical protein